MNDKTIQLKDFFKENIPEAGCDEAGRGCLAGPVFAAAVILDPQKPVAELNDSKILSEKKRYELRKEIEQKALSWSVAMIDNHEIDRINIFKASMKAMHFAIDGLNLDPEHLLIDGNNFITYKNIPHTCIVKGDSKYKSIAAASILAKTYRDDYIKKIHPEFDCYRWNANKGYATLFHRNAIKQFGISKYHRKSFNLIDQQLKFDF